MLRGHSTEGFWDRDWGIKLEVGGQFNSQAGTETVSLHGERKWAPKQGGGRVQAPKLISCRSQTQPQGRNNMCVCLSACEDERARESTVNSEGHTMAEGERQRPKKRGADLHQRV